MIGTRIGKKDINGIEIREGEMVRIKDQSFVGTVVWYSHEKATEPYNGGVWFLALAWCEDESNWPLMGMIDDFSDSDCLIIDQNIEIPTLIICNVDETCEGD
jgi:hypothetical protein